MINNGFESRDFGYKTGIRDLNNVAPRVGFAYNVGGEGDLVIRGGSGLYYNTPVSNVTYSHQFYNRAIAATFLPDGPGFMENPTRGVTAEDYLSGSVPAPVQTARIIADDYVMPSSWQSSIGFQKQLGAVMGFDVGPDLPGRAQPGARPRSEPVLRPGHRLQPRSRALRAARIRSTARSSGWRAPARPRRCCSRVVHPPVPRQLPGRRHLHAHAAPQRQHHRVRHPGQQPVRSRRRLVAFDRLPARHVPGQRHRQPAVAGDGRRLVLLRLRQLLQRHAVGPALQQAGHQPPEPRRADHHSGRRARPLGGSGRDRDRRRCGRATRCAGCRSTRWTCACRRRIGSCRQRRASTLLAEVFNLFNRENYGSYNTQLDSATLRPAGRRRRATPTCRDRASSGSASSSRPGTGRQPLFSGWRPSCL